jgi:hypothetical protein
MDPYVIVVINEDIQQIKKNVRLIQNYLVHFVYLLNFLLMTLNKEIYNLYKYY